MKTKLLQAILLIVLSIFISCKHTPIIPDPTGTGNNGGTPSGGTPGGSNAGTGICFESQILPLFQSNCAKSGCHDALSAKEGFILDNYANIVRKGIKPGNASESKIFTVLSASGEDRMPPQPNPALTTDQKNLIGKWINEGARNTTNCSTGCDTSHFAYTADIKPVLATYCTGCHGGTAPSANIDLTTYASVLVQVNNGNLWGSVTHSAGYSPMPKGGNQLSTCNLRIIGKWIEQGAPNN